MSGTAERDLVAQYEALRHACGAHRLGRDVLSVTGPQATDYLQGQCSQDVAALDVGGSADTLLLEPDGKLSALVRVVRTAEDTFVLDVEAGFGEAVAQRLARFKLRTKVEIAPLDWPCVALRGPLVGVGIARRGLPSGVRALPFSWNGTEGVDLLGPEVESAVPEGALWCGTQSWEALRVEAGIPAMGRELDGRTIAAEAWLVERAVSFTKGCYTGQELVARLDARGSRVARRLCGLVPLQPDAGDPKALSDAGRLVGAEVVATDAKVVGRVTSAAWCPGLGGPGALSYLHRSVAVPGPVTVLVALGDGGGTVALAAEARPLPLVV